MTVKAKVDDLFYLYADGVLTGSGDQWYTTYSFSIPDDTVIVALYAHNTVIMHVIMNITRKSCT